MGPIQDVATAPGGTKLGCGGLHIQLRGEHSDWLAMANDRYRAFSLPSEDPSVEASLNWRLDYTVQHDVPLTPLQLYQARQAPLSFDWSAADQLTVSGLGFTGSIDWGNRLVAVHGPLATYPIDLLLPILWYGAHEDGLIIHAAALADHRWGYLMAGPSGAGKTTLTRLFPELALADEFAAIWHLAAPLMTGLPFWRGRNGTAPTRGIFLLRHGTTNQCSRVSSGEALRRLRPQISWPTFDEQRLAKAFHDVHQLVEQVPVYDLAFKPDRAVWATVEACEP